MSKDWQRGSGYVYAPKIEKGITIEATNANETQEVDVRGTKRIRAEKKPVKAKWY
jgi:hypothetical protein